MAKITGITTSYLAGKDKIFYVRLWESDINLLTPLHPCHCIVVANWKELTSLYNCSHINSICLGKDTVYAHTHMQMHTYACMRVHAYISRADNIERLRSEPPLSHLKFEDV